jgi:SAM-dependent methyltransferase
MEDKLIGEAFDNSYHAARKMDHNLRTQMYLLDLKFIKNLIPNLENMNILDIGCSNGEFLSLFTNVPNKYGVEINAEQRVEAKKLAIEIFESIEDASKSNVNFDLIILRGTLHYLKDYEIENIFKMKSRYVAILQAVNFDSFAIKRIGAINFRFIYPNQSIVDSVNHFGVNKLNFIAGIHGYRTLKVDYPYLITPYSKPISDMLAFFKRVFLVRKKSNKLFNNALPFNIFRSIHIIDMQGKS